MRIEQTNRTANSARARKAAAAGEGRGFTLGMQSDTAQAAATGAPAPIEGIEALIALQAVGQNGSGRKQAVARGRQMLDALDELKLTVLSGQADDAVLLRLRSALAAEKGAAEDDPGLLAVLKEIELRAEVEIAKRANRG